MSIRLCLLATILALGCLVHSAAARQQQPPGIEYTLTLDQPHTQFVSVSMLLRDVRGEHVDVMLPAWRPGRYVIMNQAAAIRDVWAGGDDQQPLHVDKVDKTTWRVRLNGSRSLRFNYDVYCNSLNDRMRHVDDTHAFLDGAAVFMYVADRRQRPCTLRIVKPGDWKIACGLDVKPNDPNTLHAPNFDTLIDSPLEIGIHQTIDFEAAGKPHQVVIWGEADFDADKLKRDFTKIVEEETKIFGSAPYQRYLFIIHAGAGASGGTEHVNSTVMQASRAALEDNAAYLRFLSLVTHEFFHTWNVKSFRPRGIHPYDYQRENYTELLWVAEGTTSYYDDLMLVRTSHTRPNRYMETLSNAIDAMRNRPAETAQSVEQASFDAWIQYGHSTPDDVNAKVDFYGKGALVSLLIDMEMRRRSDGKAKLDQVMRALYERFPLNGPGYTSEDLQKIIEELSGADFEDVFEKHVRGAQPIDFEAAFSAVGLELHFRPATDDDEEEAGETRGRAGRRRAARESNGDADTDDEPQSQPVDSQPASQPAEPRIKAYLGLNLADSDGRTTVSSVPNDGPAFAAGILAGDEVVALDGRRLTAATLDARLKKLKPGQTVTLLTFRREQMRQIEIVLAGKPDGRWTLRRVREPTAQQKAQYESWLGQPWP
jgi:predicted metalloprotease with PDZ domain